MSLAQLKTATAAYLGVSEASLTVSGLDLWILAVNQVVRAAELNFNFEFTRGISYIDLETGGVGNLGDIQEGTWPFEGAMLNTVIDVGIKDENDNFIPVEWTTSAESFQRQRQENRFQNALSRYPRDGEVFGVPNGAPRVTFFGNRIQMFPKPTEEPNPATRIWIEGYMFKPDWTTDDLASDFDPWTTIASQYLLWGCVLHLNHMSKTFVPRTEGNLAPPSVLRDEGLEVLKQWDANKYDQFRRHGR